MVLLTIILASSFVAAAIIPIEALNTRNLETLVEKRNGTDGKSE